MFDANAKELFQKQIDHVMSEFDFEKAAKVYAFMGWKLASHVHGVHLLPGVEKLKKVASLLFKDVLQSCKDCPNERIISISTGGLVAEVDLKFNRVSLYFVALEKNSLRSDTFGYLK